jgi:hypothetical protein
MDNIIFKLLTFLCYGREIKCDNNKNNNNNSVLKKNIVTKKCFLWKKYNTLKLLEREIACTKKGIYRKIKMRVQ